MKAKSAKISTLSELKQFIVGDSSIPDSERPYLLWAVRRVRLLLGHGAPDWRFDPKAIMAQLHQLSPATAGLSPRSLANLKSRFRAVLRHAEPRLARGRSRTRLVGQWAAHYARLPRRQKFALSRFMRFAQDTGVSPDQVDECVVLAFEEHLAHMPRRLVAEAEVTHQRFAAGLVRDAVAVELLLTCSMRVSNLARLQLGETIQKVGTGASARWVIDIPKEEVKNGQPLRFTLPPPSAQLLERYLATWQNYWSGPGCAWPPRPCGRRSISSRHPAIMAGRCARGHVASIGSSLGRHPWKFACGRMRTAILSTCPLSNTQTCR